jgi:hypothetical protein
VIAGTAPRRAQWAGNTRGGRWKVVAAAIVAVAVAQGVARWTTPPLPEARSRAVPIQPLASRADPDFRITAVHFWQGNWNYTFWSNLRLAAAASELRRIRSLGFNAIVLTIPWGEFQLESEGRRYSEDRYAKLDALLSAAAEQHLLVVLRVGTLEHTPPDVADATSYSAPHLFFDDQQLAAYADLARETARRTAAHPNVLFLFFTWEDLMGFMNVAHEPEASRAAYARRVPAFTEHLRARPIAHWNARWGTSFADAEHVGFPAYASAAYAELWRFADDRLIHHVLPTLADAAHAGHRDVRLSYEIRIDADPIEVDGKRQGYDHAATWDLPAGYDLVTAYFNPYWEALNRGDVIAPETALRHFRKLLDRIAERTKRPLFFDQFNFVDSTPAFRNNSRLGGERAIASFLQPAIAEIYRRALGYALWSLDRYEANVVYNSSFESDLQAWDLTGNAGCGAVRDDAARHERYLRLEPGCSARQLVSAPWNPGAATPDVPYSVRLLVRGPDGGRVHFEVEEGTTWKETASRSFAASDGWSTVELEVPFATRFRLAIAASGTDVLDVDDLTVFNHVQDAALFDTRGTPLGRRAQTVTGEASRWSYQHRPRP